MRLNVTKYIVLGLLSVAISGMPVFAAQGAKRYNFNTMRSYQLTPKINLRFETSTPYTIIQWGLQAGAKLPTHAHINEQVTRILKGDVTVQTAGKVYELHAGDVMMFPANVDHSFTAKTDAVMYELQTPIRKDFLEKDFIEKISQYLQANQ